MGGESVLLFGRSGIADELVGGADLRLTCIGIGVAEKTVGGEGDAVAQTAAEHFVNRNLPRLTEYVETGEFDSSKELRAVVVERGGGICEEEAHLLEA